MWPRFVSASLGIWLMVAPAALGHGGSAADNDRICGPIAASVAIIALWEATRGLRWVNLFVGAWLSVAAWVLPYTLAGRFNTAAVGLALTICASVAGRVTGRYGGGWAALLPGRRTSS